MLKQQCLFEAMPIPALAGSRTPAVLTGDAVVATGIPWSALHPHRTGAYVAAPELR